jgi:hypothetical protein
VSVGLTAVGSTVMVTEVGSPKIERDAVEAADRVSRYDGGGVDSDGDCIPSDSESEADPSATSRLCRLRGLDTGASTSWSR